MSFTLHPQLAKDCIAVGDLPACRVLLMNDRRFPWLVLVPRKDNLRELFDIGVHDYADVMAEIRNAAKHFASLHNAYKMNVATLGNKVEQLHFHIIARFENDAAWPGPVWGVGTAEPYGEKELPEILDDIRHALNITKM